ncbi:Lsr2 family DNA-binding protein [Streptomyces mirabilis]
MGSVQAPTVADVRAWARERGMDVLPRGRLRAEIWDAWHAAHPAVDAHEIRDRPHLPRTGRTPHLTT